MPRVLRLGVVSAFAVLAASRLGHADVGLFADPPRLDEEAKTIDLMLGTRLAGIERTKLENISVRFGKKPGKIVSSQPFLDYATDKSRSAEGWRPPVTVGLLYLWTEGTPPEMLDGIHRLFKRLPPQTVVLPTPFGQSYFPVVNPISAARVAGGGLDDQPFIEGDAITFLKAARANVAEVAKDDGALKALVIVADGRDYTAQSDPGPFAAFGKELREAGYITQIVGLPTDDDAAKANLRALAHAAGARLLVPRQASEVAALTEAAGTLFFDSRVLRVKLPVSLRLFGGEVMVTVEATADGKTVAHEAGALSVPASGGLIVIIIGLVLTLGGAVGAIIYLRRRRPAGSDGEDDMEGFLDAVQELVRRRVEPERAAVELSRWYPSLVSELPNIDVNDLDADEYRLLKSRAGQARLAAFAKAIGNDEEEAAAAPADDVIGILAAALAQSLSPADAARLIRARLPDRRWASFARARFDEITTLLKQGAATHAALGSPRARTFVLSVQDALRDRDGVEIVVGWLVRAAGPGQRGESLRLARSRTVIGSGGTCQLRIEDQHLGAEHLAISESAGAFGLQVLQGAVKVEGQPVQGERALVDGETLEFGQGQYIFKAVVDG